MQFRIVRYDGNPSKVAVATNNIMNIKLKILELKILVLKIKHHTYSSSSEYKLSTGKQLQGLGTRTSYKLCRDSREVGKL